MKISVVAFWQREIFDLKVVKYLDELKSLKTLVYLPLLINKPSIKLTNTCGGYELRMKNMRANPQSNWLNTIAVRASYILPILKRFSC